MAEKSEPLGQQIVLSSNKQKSLGTDRLQQYISNTTLLQTVTLSVLLVTLVIHLLVFAEEILLPVTFGFFLSILLYSPLRLLQRLLIPKAVAALLLVITVITGLLASGYTIRESALDLLQSMPQVIEEIRNKTFVVEQAIEDVQQQTSEVEIALSDVMENSPAEETQVVIADDLSLQDQIVEEAVSTLWLSSVTLLLCYFFLVGGDALARNIASIFNSRQKQVQTFRLFRKVREHISNYLGVTLVVNLGYGLVIGLILYFLGIELAILWGLGAGILRYVPFVGTIITVSLISVITLTYHDNLTLIILVPCVVMVINFITGSLIEPLVHSHHFKLNPIAIFISIIFWGWIWGAAGLFIAIPSLITAAVICQHIAPLSKLYLIVCLQPAPQRSKPA